MPAPIVVVGSLNADLVVHVDRFPRPGETLSGDGFTRFPGGKGANQAYAAARLGGMVAMVGQVGADDHGAWLSGHLAAGGVDTAAVLRDAQAATGVALITVDATGQNHIVLVAGANGTFTPDRLAPVEEVVRGARVVLLQLEIPLDTVVAAARIAHEAGAQVILDPAPARAVPDTLLELSTYVTPNETELLVMTGGGDLRDNDDVRRRAQQLMARGSPGVLVKLGARGAALIGRHEEHWWSAHEVSVVDTTAAGDAFNGALAVALTEGQPLDRAGRFANAAASITVTRAGAQTSMPERKDVECLLVERR
jgi:ribokinase